MKSSISLIYLGDSIKSSIKQQRFCKEIKSWMCHCMFKTCKSKEMVTCCTSPKIMKNMNKIWHNLLVHECGPLWRWLYTKATKWLLCKWLVGQHYLKVISVTNFDDSSKVFNMFFSLWNNLDFSNACATQLSPNEIIIECVMIIHKCTNMFCWTHHYNSWFFWLGFLVKKYSEVIGIKKSSSQFE